MTSQDEQVFPYYRSPDAIRDQVFAHRMRGLDEEEVYEYLDLLADQVQATELERAGMRAELHRLKAENEVFRAENDRLRSENERLGAHQPLPPAPSNRDTEVLFRQAQQVADQVVEEAVRHARDLLAAARAEQREILQRARAAAESATARAPAAWEPRATGYASALPAPDHVRATRVAQAQLRTLVQALAEQVERLVEPSGALPSGPVVSGDDQLPAVRPAARPYDGHRYP
jgi:cell division initiation protein